MARLRQQGLRRTVGVPGMFATAYGNVGSSIYYALGLVASHALGLTPLVFIFAGGLFALTAKTYAEGASMFPEAGGSSSFARHAFNEVASFFAGWALTLDYIITIAISAFFVPHYLGAFFPALRHPPGDVIGGIAVIAGLAALNIRGIGESAKLNIFLAAADLVTQVLLVALGAVLVLNPSLLVDQVHLGVAPSYRELLFGLSISMVAYTGIETVSNMAEESKDPDHDVPKTVNLVLIAVLGIFAGISIISLSALPVHEVSPGPLRHPARHDVRERPGARASCPRCTSVRASSTVLRYYVGVLAATILIIATNAGLIGISRLSWSLAEHRQLPTAFARLSRRYGTPYFTIILFSLIAAVLLTPGQTDFLGNLYSFGAMLSFTTAHVAVIALRVRKPDQRRPYRMPWNVRIRGKRHPAQRRARRHRDLRRLGVRRGPPRRGPARGHSLDGPRHDGLRPLPPSPRNQRVGRPHDRARATTAWTSRSWPTGRRWCRSSAPTSAPRAMRSAAKLVGEDAEVDAVYVLQVPAQLSLDAGMEDEETDRP